MTRILPSEAGSRRFPEIRTESNTRGQINTLCLEARQS